MPNPTSSSTFSAFAGYYNKNSWPVQIRLGGVPATIESGAMVVINGEVIEPPHDALEEEVRLGMLSRFKRDDPKFVERLKQARQRSKANVRPATDDEKRAATPKQKIDKAPDVTITSARSPQHTEEKVLDESNKGGVESFPKDYIPATASEALKEGFAVRKGNRIEYDGVKLSGEAALSKFLDRKRKDRAAEESESDES